METVKRITSVKNEYIRYLRSLKNKSDRDAAGEFIVEGEKCVREAVNSGWEISGLILNSVAYVEHETEYGRMYFGRCIMVSDQIIEALSDSKTPQGILACVRKKLSEPVYGGLTVALDDVSDPTNVGSIIRSADAAGASAVIMSERCADVFSQRAVRASMGSLFHIPVVYTDLDEYLKKFSETGTVICGHLKGSDSFSVSLNTCIVTGNEARGVSDHIASLCDIKYRIPIYGKAESLNVGVAAGIMLYSAAEKIRSLK